MWSLLVFMGGASCGVLLYALLTFMRLRDQADLIADQRERIEALATRNIVVETLLADRDRYEPPTLTVIPQRLFVTPDWETTRN